MDKIAVLVPTYRPKHYINDCIKSVEDQDMDRANFKVYFALNGPKDPYENIVLDALRHVTFQYEYVYVDNQGVSNARNALLELSTESHILFLDDDDMLSANLLSTLYRARSNNSVIAAHVFRFGEGISYGPNYVGRFIESTAVREFTSLFKCRKILSSACAKLIPRQVVQQYRFAPELKIGEDSFFMACISPFIKKVKIQDDCVYYVNHRSDSTSREHERISKRAPRILVLIFKFTQLLFIKEINYDSSFILTRILAVALSLFR